MCGIKKQISGLSGNNMSKYKLSGSETGRAHSEHNLLRTAILEMDKQYYLHQKSYNIYKYNKKLKGWRLVSDKELTSRPRP
jgi:hypothetical protein